jgi:hypothetical protein
MSGVAELKPDTSIANAAMESARRRLLQGSKQSALI